MCRVLVGGLPQILEKKPYKEEAIIAAHTKANELLGLETSVSIRQNRSALRQNSCVMMRENHSAQTFTEYVSALVACWCLII